MRSGCPNGLSDGLALVASQIVHDDDITRGQVRNEDLFHIGQELEPIDRSIEDARGIDPIASQGCQEGLCTPVTVRGFADQARALGRPSAQRRHVCLGPGLINKNEAFGIEFVLIFFPTPSPAGNVRPVLLKGVSGFF